VESVWGYLGGDDGDYEDEHAHVEYTLRWAHLPQGIKSGRGNRTVSIPVSVSGRGNRTVSIPVSVRQGLQLQLDYRWRG